MTAATHPAASLEFLSRLHDGELAALERADFEAHLAECPECRAAVAAFEASLTAFRAAPVAPVPTDLSARILRKIRAQSPSRRPFGVMFGIDIRWAGVFLAALLVSIILAPSLLKQRVPRGAPSASEPLTAYVVDAEPDARDAAAPKAEARAKAAPKTLAEGEPRERKAPERSEPPRAADALAQAAPEPQSAAAAPPPDAAGGAFAQKPEPGEGARNAAPPAAAAKRSAAAAERVGGEAGFVGKEEAQTEDVRIDVRSLDSDGRAPEIVQTPPAERLTPLRGREFVLIVEADGFVRGVLPARRQDEQTKLMKDKDNAAGEADADAPLRQLRFRATGKPRRVLVAIR